MMENLFQIASLALVVTAIGFGLAIVVKRGDEDDS